MKDSEIIQIEEKRLYKFYKVIEQHLTKQQMIRFQKIRKQKQSLSDFAMVESHKEVVKKCRSEDRDEKRIVEAWLAETAEETWKNMDKADLRLEDIEEKLHTYRDD